MTFVVKKTFILKNVTPTARGTKRIVQKTNLLQFHNSKGFFFMKHGVRIIMNKILMFKTLMINDIIIM